MLLSNIRAWIRVMALGAATALLAPSAMAQALPPQLAAAWAATGLPDSALSLVAEDADGNRILAVNPDQPRNPASVMKLITTFAALDSLGPAYVWRTELLTMPGTTVAADGTLSGPLFLRAVGDPQFRMQDLWQLLRELRLRGVRRIPEFVVDRSIFGQVEIDPGAFDNDPTRPYNAGPDAWMVGLGAVRMLFTPDAAQHRWRLTLDPALPGVKVEGALRWDEGLCHGSPSVHVEPFLESAGVTLRLSGAATGACGEFSVYRLALPQPQHAMGALRALWREMGGSFTGRVHEGRVPPDAVPFVAHDSPPLAQTVRQINKFSNNVMARTLLLDLGAAYEPPPATVASGGRALTRILANHGLDFPELVIANGSGLSREGRVSAASLASLLLTAWRSPVMPEFVSSLSIAGEDGTFRKRLRTPGTERMAHLKSGSLRDVRAVAGYVLSSSGRRYMVASIVNDEKAEQANAFHDMLIEWLSTQ